MCPPHPKKDLVDAWKNDPSTIGNAAVAAAANAAAAADAAADPPLEPGHEYW